MKETQTYLLPQRDDGKFLHLDRHVNTTDWSFVDEPEMADRPHVYEEGEKIMPATYYYEPSYRARNIWIKDCVMVPYEITTEVTAVKIGGPDE